MNLIFSGGVKEDLKLNSEGHIFLGAGKNHAGVEVHVFLHKDKTFPDLFFKDRLAGIYFKLQEAGMPTSGMSVAEDIVCQALDDLNAKGST